MALVVVAGCGNGTDTPRATETPSPRPSATPSATTAITISSPRAGARVKAGRTLAVTGRADPGTTVLLDAGCAAAGCQAVARANAAGRWRGTLRPRAARTTIAVSTVTSDPLDRVRIRVVATAAVTPIPESEPQSTPAPRPTRVVVVGDSLTVGIETLLPALLDGYTVSIDARNGRPLAEGMAIIERIDVSSQPTVLAVGLFTNDDPHNVDLLEAAVRRTVDAVGPGGCAVWATIARPPYLGATYRAANARLAALEAELSPRLILVPWVETVRASPSLMGDDAIHPTPEGYQARAALYANAARSCGG